MLEYEKKEEYNIIYRRCQQNESDLQEELEKARRSYKFRFYMGAGMVKLSSIHSFKGWEIDTLFLIIDESNNTGTD